ncbi:MAG TPA: hypothetical protein VGE17_04855 [Methylophilus sp.]
MTIRMTTLIYRYQGPSIPPPYQRNAEITVDVDRITLLVYSADALLCKTEQPAPAGMLDQLAQWLQDYHVTAEARPSELETAPHPGAGIHTLTIYAQQQKIFDASTAQHADTTTAKLSGDIEGFVQRLTRCVNHYAEEMRTP